MSPDDIKRAREIIAQVESDYSCPSTYTDLWSEALDEIEQSDELNAKLYTQNEILEIENAELRAVAEAAEIFFKKSNFVHVDDKDLDPLYDALKAWRGAQGPKP